MGRGTPGRRDAGDTLAPVSAGMRVRAGMRGGNLREIQDSTPATAFSAELFRGPPGDFAASEIANPLARPGRNPLEPSDCHRKIR